MSSIDFFAGLCGGAAGVVLGHPLDTVKVHIQMNSDYRRLTFRHLYAGISSPLICLSLINSVVFGTYGLMFNATRDPIVSGSVSGFTQSFVTSPMELVKTHAQCAQQSVRHVTRRLLSESGFAILFRGLPLTVARDTPAFGIYFYSYDRIFEAIRSDTEDTRAMLLSGGMAGTLSWIFLYPLDVIKTRVQMSNDSFRVCTLRLYNENGIRAFFKGIIPVICRVFPTNAVTFAIVTTILNWYERHNNNNDSHVQQ